MTKEGQGCYLMTLSLSNLRDDLNASWTLGLGARHVIRFSYD